MKKVNLIWCLLLIGTLSVNAQKIDVLARFAEYNLDTLNTFASGDVWATGKYYQWGRNVPFSGDEKDLLTTPRVEYPTDAEVWKDVFITGGKEPFNWYNDGVASDTWKYVVGYTSSGKTTPKSYKGTNLGDPSPIGYHIPTLGEMKSIIYKVTFSPEDNVSDRRELGIDMTGAGKLSNYIADYRSIDSKKTVGLRFKNTVNATAFKYEWEDNLGLKISAKLMTKELTIDQIAASDFDWSGATVRYFPAAGNLSGKSGKLSNKGNIGYYMTFKAVNPNSSTAFYLRKDLVNFSNYTRSHAFSIRCVKD